MNSSVRNGPRHVQFDTGVGGGVEQIEHGRALVLERIAGLGPDLG